MGRMGRLFTLGLALAIGFLLVFGFALGIARGILRVAPCLLQLAFGLLGSAFHLRVRVARPLADLALCASGGIVDCTFYPVLVHRLHLVYSVGLAWRRGAVHLTPAHSTRRLKL